VTLAAPVVLSICYVCQGLTCGEVLNTLAQFGEEGLISAIDEDHASLSNSRSGEVGVW